MGDDRKFNGSGRQRNIAPHTPILCHLWQKYLTTYKQSTDFRVGAGVYPVLITMSLTRIAT